MNPILNEAFISLLYVLLLGLLGFYSLCDYLKHVKAASGTGEAHGYTGATRLAVKFQSVNIPPMVTFDEDFVPGGKQISRVMLAVGGFLVGGLSASQVRSVGSGASSQIACRSSPSGSLSHS